MTTTATYDLAELQKETRMGAMGSETASREIRRIDLSHFAQRKTEIADQLWDAAVDVGFFQIVNHGIDLAEVHNAFAMTERFFALPGCRDQDIQILLDLILTNQFLQACWS